MTSYPNFKFEVLKQDQGTYARLGKIHTPHGVVETPNYIFCGTRGAIRCATPREVKEAGAQIILSNTYHMLLQPGADVVERMGGLHEFIGWDGPMLTDSGGFQIFAMGEGTMADEIKGRNRKTPKPKMMQKITEEGAEFRSYIDGAKIQLTPEKAMEIQCKLGADLLMPLDEFLPMTASYEATARSTERSHRWEKRSLERFMQLGGNEKQGLYGIIQGGVFEDLRRQSTQFVNENDFFGIAIGGSLGVSVDQAYDEVLRWTAQDMRKDRPVHLLGIGSFRDVFAGVRLGIDTFDCVTPTRIARHGWALVKGSENERLNLRNARFKEDKSPLDETQDNYVSQNFTKAYLHHLIKANEVLAMHLLSIHNIATISRLMKEVRDALANGTLDQCEQDWRGEAQKIAA